MACTAAGWLPAAGARGAEALTPAGLPCAAASAAQYLYLLFTITIMLPLSLGIDGTNWPAQFAGWAAGDWAVLAALGCAVVLAANWCIQHSTWRLGAPTVSMFYGLRLVAAIVESKLILGTTIIKTGLQASGCSSWRRGWAGTRRRPRLEAAGSPRRCGRRPCCPLPQIAGTVVTVSAVTVYMAVQWWQSRQESRATDAAAGGAAAAPAADSAGGPAAAAPKRGPTQAS